MPSLSRRLKSLTKQVEKWERNPSLVGAVALGKLDECLSSIEVMVPERNPGGRPKIWDREQLHLLEILVAEGRRRWHLESDRAVLMRVVRRVWGHKNIATAQTKVHTLQNRLLKARKLPR